MPRDIEPREGNAYRLMRGFLEFLSQNKAKFAALDRLKPKDRKRFLKALLRELLKDFLKHVSDETVTYFLPPRSFKDGDKRKFFDTLTRKLRENRPLSIKLLKKIRDTSFEPFLRHRLIF